MMKDFKERKVKNKNCHIPTEVATWNLMGIIKHILKTKCICLHKGKDVKLHAVQ